MLLPAVIAHEEHQPYAKPAAWFECFLPPVVRLLIISVILLHVQLRTLPSSCLSLHHAVHRAGPQRVVITSDHVRGIVQLVLLHRVLAAMISLSQRHHGLLV
jgi:hypothetical protein